MGRVGQPVRLYTKGVFTSYRRNHRNTTHHTQILKLEGVQTRDDAKFYLGKRVAFVYHAKNSHPVSSKVTKRTGQEKTNYRVMWGRVVAAHGNNGSVRAKFRKNLPAKALGATVRVMMYPSRAL